MKNHQNHFWESKTSLDRPIFPIKTIEYPSFGMVRIPKNFISRTIPSACDTGSSERSAWRSSQNLGFGQGVPPTEWSECLLLYIYIYIYLFIYLLFICLYIYVCIYIYINNNLYIYKGNCLWENQPQQTSSGRPGRCCSPCFDKLDDTVF